MRKRQRYKRCSTGPNGVRDDPELYLEILNERGKDEGFRDQRTPEADQQTRDDLACWGTARSSNVPGRGDQGPDP